MNPHALFLLKTSLTRKCEGKLQPRPQHIWGYFLKMLKKQQHKNKNIHHFISGSFLPHPAAYAGCQPVSSARRKPRCGAITSKSYVWTILDRSHKDDINKGGTRQKPHFPVHGVTANQSFLNHRPGRSFPKALFSKRLRFETRPLSSYSRLQESS